MQREWSTAGLVIPLLRHIRAKMKVYIAHTAGAHPPSIRPEAYVVRWSGARRKWA